MKKYESVPKSKLIEKLPVFCRLDGKAFHTFCKFMIKPYDEKFHHCMWTAAIYLCKNIPGCQLGYVQSDEITLLIMDNKTLETQAWFDYELQKMCSITASMCSVAFVLAIQKEFPRLILKTLPSFDARFWNVPVHEVVNSILWRQNDASRNSLSMQCQALYEHKDLHGKGQAQQHDLLHAKGINWNNLPTPQKRGVCIVKETYTKGTATRTRWIVDKDIPIFSSPTGRQYIERFLYPEEKPVIATNPVPVRVGNYPPRVPLGVVRGRVFAGVSVVGGVDTQEFPLEQNPYFKGVE